MSPRCAGGLAGVGKMKRQRLNTFGRARFGVFINGELRTSDAYKALTAAARLVLIDWICRYNQKSRGDSENIAMTYAFSDCAENLNYATFKRARTAILEKGFFECPPKLQTIKPGARRVFVASTKWTSYQPTPAEAKAIASAATSKRKALERWNNYRADKECAKKPRGGDDE